MLSNDEWYPGQGIRVTDGDWGIQYDSKTGWICLGKSGVEMVGQSVEFKQKTLFFYIINRSFLPIYFLTVYQILYHIYLIL